MVSTDTTQRTCSAESRGKFITRLRAPAVPPSTPKPTPDLPIVPAWLGWR